MHRGQAPPPTLITEEIVRIGKRIGPVNDRSWRRSMRRPSSHCQCPVFASNFRPIGGCPPGGRVPQKMTRMAQRPPPQRGVRSSPLPIQCRARCAVDVNGHGCESARVQQISQHQNVRRCQHWVMFFGKPRPAAGRSARSAKVSSSRSRPTATGRWRVLVGSKSGRSSAVPHWVGRPCSTKCHAAQRCRS